MAAQYCTTTLPEAITQYRNGDLTVKGLLHYYIKIRLKEGWVLRETQKQITEKLGISKSAFHLAISKLRAEGSINWSTPADTKFSISLNKGKSLDEEEDEENMSSTIVDTQSMNVDAQSMNVESLSTIVDTQSMNVDEPSYIVDKEKPEPKQHKRLKKSPSSSSSSSSTYLSTFTSSLSLGEREIFERFCLEAASRMPVQPTLISRWIEKNAETLIQEYKLRVVDQRVVLRDDFYEVNTHPGQYSAPAESANADIEEPILW